MNAEHRALDDTVAELDLHELYPELSQDEIGHLPIIRPGTMLEAGGVYFDLSAPERGPFKALAGQQAGTGNRYVAQRDLDPDIWRRLVERYRGVEQQEPVSEQRDTGTALEAPYEHEY
jgi:hypothetical protein